MAVSNIPANSVLQLELRTGVNPSGNPVYQHKSLPNIKPDALDQDIFDVATALAGLQEFPLNGVVRIDNAQLVQS